MSEVNFKQELEDRIETLLAQAKVLPEHQRETPMAQLRVYLNTYHSTYGKPFRSKYATEE